MRSRREFIAILGGMAAWPIATRAQSANRMPRIGYLMDRSGPGLFDEGFLSGLREHGYEVGRNITIEYRWTEGKTERLPALADELVALKVDAIVTAGAQAVQVTKKATTTIPIVMTSSQDAVGDGLVASLARPGGNVTGRSVYAPELTQKRIELLKEVIPSLSRVAVLWNVQNAGGAGQLREAEAAGQAIGVAIESLDVRIPDGLEAGMARAAQAGAGAVLIISDSSTISNRSQIGAAARRRNLPTIFANKAYLIGGGLMSYGSDIVDSFRLSAVYVDKILKGAKPADLPVEQPTKFELAINLGTAKAMGIEVPPTLLARADEVIE
ncbi:MAG: putative transport system substrate-binding protein [Bryobacterales bacterium]|nr:putative transport system substrate-binding protein [Bryobacterales bacterium]